MKDAHPVRNCLTLLGFACSTLVGLTCTALIGTTNVYAQATSSSNNRLEEVVVTAERRTTSLQETAISASVLNGNLLQDKGVKRLFDVQYAAPSVTVSDNGSANVINVRGLGRARVDIDIPSGVVIYSDGAPTVAGYFQNEPYFDIKSVEVLRGPQGTFVGKSAAGGAIFINTNDPDPSQFNGSAELGAGNFDSLEATGVINIPVTDTLAVRGAYHHEQRTDFYKAIVGNFTGHPGETNKNSFRFGALWQPIDQFSALAKVDYSDLDFGGNVVTSYGHSPLGVVQQNGDIAYRDKSVRATLKLKYQFNNGIKLTSLSSYQHVDSLNNLDLNGTNPVLYEFGSNFSVESYSEEVNLISPESQRLQYVVGLFYEKQMDNIPTWQKGGFTFTGGIGDTAPPFITSNAYPWLTSPWKKKEYFAGVFAHLKYNITNDIQLEGGIRLSNYYTWQYTDWTFGTGAIPPTLQFSPAGTQDLNENSIDGQVALNYNLNNNQFLYALVSRGHITGGINIFPPNRSYGEMQVINYETGWKASWLNDAFRTQFDVYYESFDNYQANFGQTGTGSVNVPDNRNAQTNSRNWGVELSGQARLHNWSLDFGLAYLNSKLGTFKNVIDPFKTAPNNIVDLTGARTPFAPEWTGNVGVQYRYPLGIYGLTLTPRVDIAYRSHTQADLWDAPQETIRARALMNTRLTLSPASGKWSAVFWIDNALNHHYVAGIQNSGTLRYAGAPRQFGVRLKYNF